MTTTRCSVARELPRNGWWAAPYTAGHLTHPKPLDMLSKIVARFHAEATVRPARALLLALSTDTPALHFAPCNTSLIRVLRRPVESALRPGVGMTWDYLPKVRDADRQRPSWLESAVELRLGGAGGPEIQERAPLRYRWSSSNRSPNFSLGLSGRSIRLRDHAVGVLSCAAPLRSRRISMPIRFSPLTHEGNPHSVE